MTTAALTDAEIDAAIERLRPSDPTKLARAIYRAGFATGLARAPAVPREPTQATENHASVAAMLRAWSDTDLRIACREQGRPLSAAESVKDKTLGYIAARLIESDADALAALRADVARLTREWQRECADADNILFASGLPEPQWRTDGGSLQVPRIVAHLQTQRERAERLAAALRCTVTKNPCGTDTWAANSSCQCVPCQAYLADRAALAQEGGK